MREAMKINLARGRVGSRAVPTFGCRAVVVLTLILVMTALACGSDSEEKQESQEKQEPSVTPQAKEAAPDETIPAREQLAKAQRQLKSLVKDVKTKRQAVERSKEQLATAREELAKAQDELQRVSREVDDRETNVALFRVVQRALLENEALDDVAIRVDVSHGVVTLHGKVEAKAQEREALETARSAAGMFDVDSEIELLSGGSADSKSGERSEASS